MKKLLSFGYAGCLSLLALLAPSVPAKATPCPLPGNFTQTYTEDFQSGSPSYTGTFHLYAQSSYQKDVYNTSILQTSQNQWRVGPRYPQPNQTNLNYNGDYEKEGYNVGNVSVVPGTGLQLTTLHTPAPNGVANYACEGDVWGNPDYQGDGTFHFSSGLINTCEEWSQLYGYFEARIQMPYGPGAGFWPAFWLLPDRGSNTPDDYYRFTEGNSSQSGPTSDYGNEFDVVEFMSTWQSASSPYAAHASSTVHFTSSTGSGTFYTDNNPPSLINPEGGFHNYAMYWGPGVVHFYIDNVDVFDVADSRVSNTPSYMILCTAVTDNDWLNNPNITEAQTAAYCPAVTTVSHVYAWQGRMAPPTSNLLLNATTTASSSDTAQLGNGPAYDPFSINAVVDGITTSDGTSNGWRSSSNTGSPSHTEWLQADMGAAYQINTVTLYPRTDQPGANFPVNFTIATSTDGSTFTPVVTQNNYPAPGSTAQTFTFPAITARYVKITGTQLSIDPSDSTYRMAFAEITGTYNPSVSVLGTVATIDPFTSPDAVTYNYWNSYHTSGSPTASDFGTVASGVWSPTTTGCNTDHFVVNNSTIQLVNVGDSASLAVKTLATDGPAIGLVLSAGLVPSGSVNQDELLLQRSTSGYSVVNYTTASGTAAQTDYSTMTITETAYNSSTQVRTFSVTVTGGGIPTISTTAYLTGANCYVGLGSFGYYSGMEGASAKNFLITRSSAFPDLALKANVSWVTSSNEAPPLWGAALMVDGLLNGSALSNGWESSSSLTADHQEQLIVDLGVAKSVGNFTLWPRTDHPGQGFPVNFAIKTSADGNTWSTQYYPTNYPLPGQAGQSFSFGPTSVRYLNVYGFNLRPDPQDSNNYRMAFAEVTATAAQTDLALNGTVTASSTYPSSPWSLADVVDGQINSSGSSYGWISNNSLTTNHTEWVQVKLPTAQNYSIITLYPRTDNPGQSFPVNFTIQTSPNGSTWTTVITRTAFPLPAAINQGQAFAVPTTNAQYIRVTGTSLRSNPSDSGYYRMGFAEITVN